MATGTPGTREASLSTQTWISATFILVFTTLISKALGFLRDVLVANYFGASAQVDAFMVAVTLATLAGGVGSALSVTLIPVYRRALTTGGPAKAGRLAGGAISLTFVLSITLILVLVIFSGPLVGFIAPSLPEETAHLAVELTRWLTGLVLGLNMIYVLSAVYNALEHFKIPAFMDLASNVCVLLALLFLSEAMGIRALALGLAVGTLLVGAAMAVPLLLRGIASFALKFWTAGVREVTVLAAPVLFWELLSQTGGIVENFFGAMLDVGSISALGYAKRLSVLVVSLLAVNIARAAFPILSKLIAEKKLAEARDILVKLSRQYVVAFVPVSIALMYFRQEIVGVVFMRGAFDATAAERTSAVLVFYAAGVVLSAAIPVCIRACYAFSDTVTPLVASTAGLATIAGLNYILVSRLGVTGIALSTTLGLIPGIAIMGWILARRLGGLDLGELLRVVGAATGCGAVALVPVAVLQNNAAARWDGFAGLAMGLAIYFTSYIALGWIVMQREVRTLWMLLRRWSWPPEDHPGQV